MDGRRSLAVTITGLLLIFVGSFSLSYAWMGPIMGAAGPGNMGAAVAYDLYADFTSSNDTCADADVIGQADPGGCGQSTAITNGSLTVEENGAGSLSITSNEVVMVGNNDLTSPSLAAGAVTAATGKTFMLDFFAASAVTGNRNWITLDNSVPPSADFVHSMLANGGNLLWYQNSGAGLDVGDFVADTTYNYAVILGGHDSTGVPYRTGQTVANFDYDSAVFIKTGAGNWELLWTGKTSAATANTATLYPYVAFVANAATGKFDNIRIPTATLESVLDTAVTALDTFTDTGGTDLTAHTMDRGAGWTSRACLANESWTVDTNKGELTTASSSGSCADNETDSYLYLDSGDSDLIVDANVTSVVTSNQEYGIYFRGKADTANGMNGWAFMLRGDGSACDWFLAKYIDGSQTDVASDTAHNAAAAAYNMRCITDGTAIDCYIAGVLEADPAAQSDHQTETWAGIFTNVAGNQTFDNYATYPRGTGGEYSALDSY